MAKNNDFDIITFAYNPNTLILVQNNRISFLTIIPLEQHRNIEILDEDQLKFVNKKDFDLVNNLQAFENSTMMKKGSLGPAYKIISLYKKLSPLQEYQLKKGYEPLSFLQKNNDISSSEEDFFLYEKNKYTVNECLNYNEYTKEDFLVVRTFISEERYSNILPKDTLASTFFRTLDEEGYIKIKNTLDQLFLIHQQNLLTDFANNKFYKISPYQIFDILAELNLNVADTYFNNFNALEHNVWTEYDKKEKNWQLSILRNASDNIPFVIVFNPFSVSLYDPSKVGSKKMKIFPGQKLKYYWNESKTLFTVSIFEGKDENIIFKVNSPFKVEEGYEKRIKYDFTLKEIPITFDNNISEKAAEILKRTGFEYFNINTEIIKKPIRSLENKINWDKKTYELLSQLPNMNGFLFKKDLVLKKLHAFESVLYHLEDGKEFSTVRFSFSVVLPYEKDIEQLTFEINQRLTTYSIEMEPLLSVGKKIADPMAYEPYISVSEKSMELENEEIGSLINLKYSNEYFNMLEDNDEENLAKIDNAHIYIKVKEKVQSINIFEGPDMFNGLIIAPSGSGKSFITVNLIDGFLSSNSANLCWILDRGGSYVNFTSTFGGNNINLKKTDEFNCINPFVFDNYFAKLIKIEKLLHEIKNYQRIIDISLNTNIQEYEEKIATNVAEIDKLIEITNFKGRDTVKIDKKTGEYIGTDFEDLMPQDKIEIFVLLLETMLQSNDLSDNNQRIIKKSAYSTFEELILQQVEYTDNNDLVKYILISDIKTAIFDKIIDAGIPKNEVVSMLSVLDEYIDPIRSGKLFNGKPALDLSSLLINIDFGEIQNETLADLVLSALLLNYFNIMTSEKFKFSKKLLIIDEAHAVLNGEAISGLKSVSYLYRTARKHGGAVWLLSQAITDFVKVNGEVAPERIALFNGIIGNAGWIWLLGVHPKNDLKERLFLNDNIADRIVNKGKSREFYIKSKVSGFATLIVSDLNYAIATTNKEEKNILAAIDLLTNNTKNSLLFYATLFGKSFLDEIKDIQNLLVIGGKNFDETGFREKLDVLYSSYSKKRKALLVNNILSTQKINLLILNVLLIKAEIDSKMHIIKNIIDASEKFHPED